MSSDPLLDAELLLKFTKKLFLDFDFRTTFDRLRPDLQGIEAIFWCLKRSTDTPWSSSIVLNIVDMYLEPFEGL